MKYFVAFSALFIVGCATTPIEIQYELDSQGVPTCNVNGESHQLTDAERKIIAQKYVDSFCPREKPAKKISI